VAGDGESIVCQNNDGWRWEPASQTAAQVTSIRLNEELCNCRFPSARAQRISLHMWKVKTAKRALGTDYGEHNGS